MFGAFGSIPGAFADALNTIRETVEARWGRKADDAFEDSLRGIDEASAKRRAAIKDLYDRLPGYEADTAAKIADDMATYGVGIARVRADEPHGWPHNDGRVAPSVYLNDMQPKGKVMVSDVISGIKPVCAMDRRRAGLSYPRTCQVCGLGPCRNGEGQPVPNAPEAWAVDVAGQPDKPAVVVRPTDKRAGYNPIELPSDAGALVDSIVFRGVLVLAFEQGVYVVKDGRCERIAVGRAD